MSECSDTHTLKIGYSWEQVAKHCGVYKQWHRGKTVVIASFSLTSWHLVTICSISLYTVHKSELNALEEEETRDAESNTLN